MYAVEIKGYKFNLINDVQREYSDNYFIHFAV